MRSGETPMLSGNPVYLPITIAQAMLNQGFTAKLFGSEPLHYDILASDERNGHTTTTPR